MLTRSRIQKGEGKLENNLEIGKRRTFPKMSMSGMEVPEELMSKNFEELSGR